MSPRAAVTAMGATVGTITARTFSGSPGSPRCHRSRREPPTHQQRTAEGPLTAGIRTPLWEQEPAGSFTTAAVSSSDDVSTVRCVLVAQRTRSKTGLPPLYLPICQQHPPLAEANRNPTGMGAWGWWSADFPSPAQQRAWELGGAVHKQII